MKLERDFTKIWAVLEVVKPSCPQSWPVTGAAARCICNYRVRFIYSERKVVRSWKKYCALSNPDKKFIIRPYDVTVSASIK